MAIWRKQEIGFEFAHDASDHPVATLVIDTPAGRLLAMAEPLQQGRTMVLSGLHIHGEQTGANHIGPANLMVLAQAFMETMDVDALVVAGGVRTTGASPNRTPCPIRFTRRAVDQVGG